jgi:phosphoribosylamine--glycine ligase
MQRHGIPTAKYQTFSDAAQAHAYIDANGAPIVIKADGLAAGKGVVVAMTLEEAHQAVDHMLSDNRFGDAGARIVIEEFLAGEEASFIVMCDGKNVLPLATSQDHKRLKDHDEGPNTGGMGAYSPAPIVTPAMHARVMREIINPTIQGMAKDGIPFTGFLYAGLMIDAAGNPKHAGIQLPHGRPGNPAHHGAPEERLRDGAGTRLQRHARRRRTGMGPPHGGGRGDGGGRLSGRAAQGRRHRRHPGRDAGMRHLPRRHPIVGGTLQTSGGRVLCVVGLGDSVKMAQKQAYETSKNPLQRRAVPPRYRLARDEAVSGFCFLHEKRVC